MKKYNVCMPIELEFERRAAEIRLQSRNRVLAGLTPIKEPVKASGASGSPQDKLSDDEPIPYKLTPLGCAVVENGLVVGEIRNIRELNRYEERRKRMNKRKHRSVKKIRKLDIQRKCQQLSMFDIERGDRQ